MKGVILYRSACATFTGLTSSTIPLTALHIARNVALGRAPVISCVMPLEGQHRWCHNPVPRQRVALRTIGEMTSWASPQEWQMHSPSELCYASQ